MNNLNNPILVASPPRSGSSITAMILSNLGLFSGETKKGDEFNIRGYFENLAISKLEVDYMRANDTENLGKRFNPINLSAGEADFGSAVKKVVLDQGIKESQRWFYKSPRMTFCWKLWHKHFPDAQWIIVRRNKHEVLKSIQQTKFMDAYNTEQDWLKYLSIFESLQYDIKKQCSAIEFDINRVFEGQPEEIDRLCKFICINPIDALLKGIDKRYWNG